MKTPAQYDPEAIRKLYNPQSVIAKQQASQNQKKQQQIQNTNQQQKQVLQQQKNPYQSFVSGPESYTDFDVDQSRNNLSKQIKHQIGYMDARGYKYQNQKDMPFIEEQMSLHLSKAGIKDLRQLGYEETYGPDLITELTEKDGKYFKTVTDYNKSLGMGGYGTKLEEVEATDVQETEVSTSTGFGQTSTKKVLKGKIKGPKTYQLINKETGEKVVQGKYGGVLTEYEKGQGFRWGNTTRTKGMTDFMIKFDEEGQALVYPRYEDTATDLSGAMMVGSIALAATGVGAGLGASLIGGAGSVATQTAIGNAFINASISKLTGGDFTKTFLTSAAVPLVSKGMNTVLSNSIFKNMPVGDTFKRVAGSAINRSVTSGVVAAINGQDIGKAMYRGALTGGIQSGASLAVNKIMSTDSMKFLEKNTNLSSNALKNITTMGITKGVYNLTQGKNFSDGVIDTMVANGVSTSVANKIGSTFKDNFENNPQLLSTIQQTSEKLTNLYVRSAMSGKQVSPAMLQQLILQQAMQPVVKKGIQKTKEIAKKARKEIEKDPRDNLELAT
jgi:hypothetical protein